MDGWGFVAPISTTHLPTYIYTFLATMEAQLQGLKVSQLKQLLQAASLPHSGNKADLVLRLLENPQATASLSQEKEAPRPTETPQAPPVPQTRSAEGAAQPPKAASPAQFKGADQQAKAENAHKVSAQAAAPNATERAEKNPEQSSEQLSTEDRKTAIIAELEKRKARAARFGQELGDTDKKLERALKFGLAGSDGSALDSLSGELGVGRHKKVSQAPPDANKEQTAKPSASMSSAKQPPNQLTKEEQAELARKERELEEQKRKRAERFGLVNKEEEEKKRKRAEKFGFNVAKSTPSERVSHLKHLCIEENALEIRGKE